MYPISDNTPCGENLDYDPDFIMLQSRLQPKLGVEYGDFFEAAEPINWTETERECLNLLHKSKDIRLIIILIRCRLRKVGLPALAEGIEALNALLCTWPDDLYPQLMDEGEFTPILRANALAELEDTNGLLADLRNQPLPKASGLQVTVKEFEKAHQVPREEGALSDTTIAALIHEWHISAREGILPLTKAHHFILEIKKTLSETLTHEAPEFGELVNILALFSYEFGDVPLGVTDVEAAPLPEPVITATAEVFTTDGNIASPIATVSATPKVQRGIGNRADALQRLQEVRSWFAMTEPSSPLIQVLKYAEDSIGKNFADLLKMYPPEIVAILNHEKE
jgi:type VI secretion system protein ImpA